MPSENRKWRNVNGISGKFWSEVPPSGTCIDRSHADYYSIRPSPIRERMVHAEMHGLAYRSTEKKQKQERKKR